MSKKQKMENMTPRTFVIRILQGMLIGLEAVLPEVFCV